jgi:hypothetical protein
LLGADLEVLDLREPAWQDPACSKFHGITLRALALNYCKVCRRHLNGALSCPGCGAAGIELSSVQDARSTMRMPRVGGDNGKQQDAELIPTSQLEDPDESGSISPKPDDAARTVAHGVLEEQPPGLAPPHARPKPVAVPVSRASSPTGGAHASDASSQADEEDEPGPAHAAAGGARRGERGQRRHGLGLVLTGGFAGIAVVGFLLFGNTGGKTAGAPTGHTVATSTSSATSSVGSALTVSSDPSASFGETPSSSPSPSASASSTSPSPSASATHSASHSPSAPSSSSAPPSASPTPTHTTRPTPSATDSTKCFLIFC